MGNGCGQRNLVRHWWVCLRCLLMRHPSAMPKGSVLYVSTALIYTGGPAV